MKNLKISPAEDTVNIEFILHNHSKCMERKDYYTYEQEDVLNKLKTGLLESSIESREACAKLFMILNIKYYDLLSINFIKYPSAITILLSWVVGKWDDGTRRDIKLNLTAGDMEYSSVNVFSSKCSSTVYPYTEQNLYRMISLIERDHNLERLNETS